MESSPGKQLFINIGIAALFLSVAFLIFGRSYQAVRHTWAAKDWQPTPATLLSVELEKSRSRANRRPRFDSEYTSNVSGIFRYTVDGKVYTSSRLHFRQSSTSLRTWYEERYAELEPKLSLDNGIVCFVDPQNPEVAVLFRDLSIFDSTAFASLGAVCLAVGAYAVLRAKRTWQYWHAA